MVASAPISAAFPPVMINIEINGRRYQGVHNVTIYLKMMTSYLTPIEKIAMKKFILLFVSIFLFCLLSACETVTTSRTIEPYTGTIYDGDSQQRSR